MKVVTLTVSRKQYAAVTITMPDDFDMNMLGRWTHEKAIREACEALDVRFEDDFGAMEVEVEDFKIKTGDEAEQELKDYAHIDWSALEQHVRKPKTESK